MNTTEDTRCYTTTFDVSWTHSAIRTLLRSSMPRQRSWIPDEKRRRSPRSKRAQAMRNRARPAVSNTDRSGERTRTGIQRYRCRGCGKTCPGRTGSVLGRIHRPDLFMVVLRNMLGTSAPQSVRKLAGLLGVDKYTVWRWRMLVFSIIDRGEDTAFSGIIEADETHQRESRKGSREWVRHFADRQNVLQPPRPRWEDFTTKGLKMMRGLSKWQLPILTGADRSGAQLFQRLPNRQSATLERPLKPLLPQDAVLYSTVPAAMRLWQQTAASNTS